MSPARPPYGGNGIQQQPPPALLPTDFPPLSITTPEKRPPLGGVWTKPVQTRSLASTPPSSTPSNQDSPTANLASSHRPSYPNTPGYPVGSSGPPLVFGASTTHSDRLAEHDRVFERPPSKINATLFNPKGASNQNGRKRGQDGHNGIIPPQEQDKPDDTVTEVTRLSDTVDTMSIKDGGPSSGKLEETPQSNHSEAQKNTKTEELDTSKS